MLVLDTHVVLQALSGDLTPRERAALSREPWGMSAISLWEVAKLAQLGHVEIDLDEGRSSDLLVHVTVGIDEQVIVRSGNARRDMVVDQIAHAEMRYEAIARREIDAGIPFGVRDDALDVRKTS